MRKTELPSTHKYCEGSNEDEESCEEVLGSCVIDEDTGAGGDIVKHVASRTVLPGVSRALTLTGIRVPHIPRLQTRGPGCEVRTDTPGNKKKLLADLKTTYVSTCKSVYDSTEDQEDTGQAESCSHTHTDDGSPPPPLCRVSHAPHGATWPAPSSPAPW